MALKVKNPKKNLADILIEKERLNESYDSSSAVSLKTLEETAEEEGTVEQALKQSSEGTEEKNNDANGPNESTVNETAEPLTNNETEQKTDQSIIPNSNNQVPSAEIPQPVAQIQPVQQAQPIVQTQPVQQHQAQQAPQAQPVQQAQPIPQSQPMQQPQPIQPVSQPFMQAPAGTAAQAGIQGMSPVPNQLRKPWEEIDDYNPPRKKRGRPYQGYSENTHVQSIYVRNDLYEYIMINYVGHGRKHSSFNKFVNSAINNYLRQLEENN